MKYLSLSVPFASHYCGYFGQLYRGRGIEVIIDLAIRRPHIIFLVVGGNTKHVNRLNAPNNIIFIPSLPHPEALYLMKLVDVLLMPYQKSVSIGIKGHDTARWMSPMKMFEYMSSHTPIISSDLLFCERSLYIITILFCAAQVMSINGQLLWIYL